MNTYLLPCECGKKIPVEAGQSGTALACVCGRTLEVPKMRDLARLTVAAEPRPQAEKPWGWRQGLALVGLLIMCGAGALAAYEQFNRAPVVNYDFIRAEAEKLDPEHACLYWAVFRDFGIQTIVPQHLVQQVENGQPNLAFDPALIAIAGDVRHSLGTAKARFDVDADCLRWMYVAGCIAVAGAAMIVLSFVWPQPSPRSGESHRARPRAAS